jgi:hypothetical protein
MQALRGFMFEFVTGKNRVGRYVRMRLKSEPPLRQRDQDLHIRLKPNANDFDAEALAATLSRLVDSVEVPDA